MVARVTDAASASVALGEGTEGKRDIGYRADGEKPPFVVGPGVCREEIGQDPG